MRSGEKVVSYWSPDDTANTVEKVVVGYPLQLAGTSKGWDVVWHKKSDEYYFNNLTKRKALRVPDCLQSYSEACAMPETMPETWRAYFSRDADMYFYWDGGANLPVTSWHAPWSTRKHPLVHLNPIEHCKESRVLSQS